MIFVKVAFRIFTALIILALGFGASILFFLSPPGNSETPQVFVVPEDQYSFDIPKSLSEQKLIRNEKAFRILFTNFSIGKEIKAGGYRISPKMNAWQVLTKITGKPDLIWFTVTACQRKEQIGEKLAKALEWDDAKLKTWNNLYSDTESEYFEGVFYPDTYLLPYSETPADIAQRFINNFNQKFAPLADAYIAKNIKWTTGLKIASLIAREAGGKSDMPLISGVIWNRLNEGIPLQIDATMQYTLGKNANGSWWGSIDLSQKGSDSPYNSYKNKGLPPTPICSPNIDAIEAALNPKETDCIFYLHDSTGQIHCSKTYKEHLENIQKYL